MTEKPTALKVLLRQHHLQGHTAFCKEYDKVAKRIDHELIGSWPSKAQFYRWLSGELRGLPYAHHCRILESMFPDWKADQLFQPHNGAIEFEQPVAQADVRAAKARVLAPSRDIANEVVALYAHRSDTPKKLWLDLLTGAQENIDLFANASLFLPEENPEAIALLKQKAAGGTRVRILLGDPDNPAMALRGREERLFDAIPARIRMALAYYGPLVGTNGVEFRLHGTSLYNSIFRYDNHMLVNQHIYGTYGYIAPILHLERHETSDLFDTYLRSFELVWQEESRELTPVDR